MWTFSSAGPACFPAFFSIHGAAFCFAGGVPSEDSRSAKPPGGAESRAETAEPSSRPISRPVSSVTATAHTAAVRRGRRETRAVQAGRTSPLLGRRAERGGGAVKPHEEESTIAKRLPVFSATDDRLWRFGGFPGEGLGVAFPH
ncbi:MAG: hypothetical protein BUE48_012675 [Thermomonospora sp. CIF 1]|nr:MAG: hypothetical protein BUE48_012675 [Thermomonospora sp. CIF 1]